MKLTLKAFNAFGLSMLAILVNSILENCSAISRWLGEGCPQYIKFLGAAGVSWISCWVASIAIFIVYFIYSIISETCNHSARLAATIAFGIIFCLPGYISLDVVMRSTVAMSGGFYQIPLRGVWDLVVVILSALLVMRYLYKYKVFVRK